MKLKKFNVTSITNYIKVSLESDIILSNINIEGEVSNLKYHVNGNIYFSLKDDNCKINCVMYSDYAKNLNIEIQDGDKVDIVGRLFVYAKEGNYQITCYLIEKQGLGEEYKKFEIIKNTLKEKGYFDESRKKPIPKICFNIGIITSFTGAVINDIMNVSIRKNSLINFKVFNSLVQGSEAYKNIIQGITYFNREKNVDVIIIARGGGSFEDLNPFNNEMLAEEIYKSEIPIVSGVGHETDFTICDFVSDLRASTPTAAAEICIPNIEDIRSSINEYKNLLNRIMESKIEIFKNMILTNKVYISSYSPLNVLRDKQIFINKSFAKLNDFMKNTLSKNKLIISELKSILEKNDFNEILNKGFVLIRDEKSNFIRSANEVSDFQKVSLIFKDGSIDGTFLKEGGREK